MADQPSANGTPPPWRHRIHEIIFEADTPAGKAFDLALHVLIIGSVVAVMLESVPAIRATHGRELYLAEWAFTIVFTIEYIVRLASVRRPMTYARSMFGIVDLLAILPTYLSLLIPGAQSLLVIRALRLLRVFRILKLGRYVDESQVLVSALIASRQKIIVFLTAVVTLVLLVGAAMYLIEGADSGFTSIPQSTYWAIVTMTTVGYGDIAPQTVPGKMLASVVMVLGYGIIAVPTGIVTAELTRPRPARSNTQVCPHCMAEGHANDATYCRKCSERLNPES